MSPIYVKPGDVIRGFYFYFLGSESNPNLGTRGISLVNYMSYGIWNARRGQREKRRRSNSNPNPRLTGATMQMLMGATRLIGAICNVTKIITHVNFGLWEKHPFWRHVHFPNKTGPKIKTKILHQQYGHALLIFFINLPMINIFLWTMQPTLYLALLKHTLAITQECLGQFRWNVAYCIRRLPNINYIVHKQ